MRQPTSRLKSPSAVIGLLCVISLLSLARSPLKDGRIYQPGKFETALDDHSSRDGINVTAEPPTATPTIQAVETASHVSPKPLSQIPSELTVVVQQNISFPQFMTMQEYDPGLADPPNPNCAVTDASLPGIYKVSPFPRTYRLHNIIRCVYGDPRELSRPIAKGRFGTVACSIPQQANMQHFPHALQYILPCWSLWRRYPTAQHVMVIKAHELKSMNQKSSFNMGMVKVLTFNNITIDAVSDSAKQYITDYNGDKDKLLVAEPHVTTLYRISREGHMVDFVQKSMACTDMQRDQTTYCAAMPRIVNRTQQHETIAAHRQQHLANLTTPRIAILNRRRSRRLLNSTAISHILRERLQLPYKPPVFYFETLTFEEQAEAFGHVDILVSPHGAQLTGIFFMPQCGSVVELFPRGYYKPPFFGSLAGIANLRHSHIYLGTNLTQEMEDGMKSLKTRNAARAPPLCAPVDKIVEAVQAEVQNWRQCCGGLMR